MAAHASLSQSLQVSLALQHSDVWIDHGYGKATSSTSATKTARNLPKFSSPAVRRKDNNDDKGGEYDDVSCGVRFWLAAASYGPEIVSNFEAIYGILSMQYLGVPVYLVSMSGIVCGLVSMIIIPAMGSFADTGVNPKRRKALVLLVGLATFIIGLSTLTIASGLKANELNNALKRLSNLTTDTTVIIPHGNSDNITVTQQDGGYSTSSSSFQTETSSIDTSMIDWADDKPVAITTTGFLAIIGFALIDIGFDSSMSQVRTFLVDNVPKHQKAHILASATLVAAGSATTIAFIGTFDLPSVLGPALGMDGIAATLIVICLCLLVSITLMYIATFTAGLFINRRRRSQEDEQCLIVSNENPNEPSKANVSDKVECLHQNCLKYDISSIQLSKSITKYKNGMMTYGTCSRETNVRIAHARRRARKSAFLSQWKFIFNKRLILLLITSFFGFATLLVMAVYMSNTLTIEVLKGDPRALPGTDGNLRYEHGLRVASQGLLIANLCYLAVSLVLNKLLDFFGPKLLFLLTTAMMGGTCTLFCVVQSVPTYFLLMASYGPQRGVAQTTTFLLATTYTQSKDKNKGVGAEDTQTNLAKVMSLLGLLLTLSYLLLSVLMGPLMDATNSAWPPAYYLIGCSTIAILPLSILMFL